MLEEHVRRDAERVHDRIDKHVILNDEAAVKSGEAAIRTVILSNGGAVVAVLAFLGNLSSKVSPQQISAVANSLTYFSLGVAAGLLAMLGAYFTNYYHSCMGSSWVRTWQHPYFHDGPETPYYRRLASLYHWLAIIAGTASLLLLIYGIVDVRAGILSLSTN